MEKMKQILLILSLFLVFSLQATASDFKTLSDEWRDYDFGESRILAKLKSKFDIGTKPKSFDLKLGQNWYCTLYTKKETLTDVVAPTFRFYSLVDKDVFGNDGTSNFKTFTTSERSFVAERNINWNEKEEIYIRRRANGGLIARVNLILQEVHHQTIPYSDIDRSYVSQDVYTVTAVRFYVCE